MDVQDREEVSDREAISNISGRDDDVEVLSSLLHPLLIRSDDEVLGSHLHGVFLLAVGVREDGNLGTHTLGSEHDGKVAETTETDDSNLLASCTPVSHLYMPKDSKQTPGKVRICSNDA